MSHHAIQPKDLSDARLYADRYELVRSLGVPKGGAIAEVGVAHGDFSKFLMDNLQPRMFAALDLFEMHKYPVHWGIPQEILLKGMEHEAFYRDRFKETACELQVYSGLSYKTIPNLPDDCFHLIYIDAGHDYENVKRDAELAAGKLKRAGTLVFNDYIMFDHALKEPYGVVRAVNELISSGEWVVVGFGLQRDMFCDIAVQRREFAETKAKPWKRLARLFR